MEYHLNRGGADLGRHSLEQLRQGLASGLYLPTDLVWREGMEKWLPISEYFEAWDRAHAGGQPPPVAWERRKELGFWPALFRTLTDVLFDPVKAFRGWKAEHDLAGAFYFALLVGAPCALISALYQLPFQMVQWSEQMQGGMAALGTGLALVLWLVIMVTVVPFSVMLGVVVGAGLAQLGLWMLGGARRGFETTLRVNCYATGASSVFYLVPFCGGFLVVVWYYVALIVGLKEAHEIPAWKAAVATLAWLVLCCGMCLGGIIVVAGMAAGSHAEWAEHVRRWLETLK